MFWISIPCPIQANVLREIANLDDCKVTLICHQNIPDIRRKQTGWKLPDFGRVKWEVLPEISWKKRVDDILKAKNHSVHIFGALLRLHKFRYARRKAFKQGLKTGIITEIPVNQEEGVKRLAKTLYLKALNFLIPPIARRTLFVLAISSYEDLYYFERLGWSKDRIYPFGYFVGPITNNNASNDSFRLVGGLKNVEIVYSGSLLRKKRIDTLILALALLRRKGVKFRCRIVGDGPYRAELQQLTDRLGLDNYVTFIGVRPNIEVRHMMDKADIVVLPGLLEPWGVPVNEAILSSSAVVVSSGIGARDLIKFSGAGHVFEAGNVDSLAKALSSLILRPGALEHAKVCAKAYAPRILPKVIAGYLRDVVLHATGKINRKPRPPWFNKELLNINSSGNRK